MSMFSRCGTTQLDPDSGSRHSGRSRAAVLAVVGPMSLILASLGLTSAGAQSTRPALSSATHHAVAPALAVPRTNQFCTFGENTIKANASAGVLATETPKSMAAVYAKLKAEEPVVLAAAPKQIKGDFQTLFTFANKFYGELASVKYSFLKLPHTFLLTLATSEKPVSAASKAIAAYLAKNCGIN